MIRMEECKYLEPKFSVLLTDLLQHYNLLNNKDTSPNRNDHPKARDGHDDERKPVMRDMHTPMSTATKQHFIQHDGSLNQEQYESQKFSESSNVKVKKLTDYKGIRVKKRVKTPNPIRQRGARSEVADHRRNQSIYVDSNSSQWRRSQSPSTYKGHAEETKEDKMDTRIQLTSKAILDNIENIKQTKKRNFYALSQTSEMKETSLYNIAEMPLRRGMTPGPERPKTGHLETSHSTHDISKISQTPQIRDVKSRERIQRPQTGSISKYSRDNPLIDASVFQKYAIGSIAQGNRGDKEKNQLKGFSEMIGALSSPNKNKRVREYVERLDSSNIL